MRNDIYNKNGLVFWDEQEIDYREYLVRCLSKALEGKLRGLNNAFKFIRVEAPILTPKELLNSEYAKEDVYFANDEMVLRPETTVGSYGYAKKVLKEHNNIKLPLCIWQAGKSFRNEQDKVLKNMRLKEFYQLEFQILYSESTKADYPEEIKCCVYELFKIEFGNKNLYPLISDRLPSYSENTTDIECDGMELCSMSERTDFEGAKCFEVAIGLDRCVYQKLGDIK